VNYVPPRRSDGTIQTRRPQQHWSSDRSFRILSIDGGGICGILPASVLAELEHRFLGGQSVARHFDMIAGTSTGGIIALGLAHGLTAKTIRDFYLQRGASIFPPPSSIGRLTRWLRQKHRYVYERGPLEDELLQIFGDAVLGQAQTRLCIPAFEGRHGEPWIFKTPHHPHYQKDRLERMVKVALSTAAAPTFFESLPNNGYVMVDGGLWANNPVMNALVDALACYNLDRAQVQILSLGCGETTFKVDQAKSRGGQIQWREVILAAMRAQSLNALGQAYLLIGKDHVMRIDAPESSTPIALDDARRAREELPAMGRSLVEGAGREIARVFFTDMVDPFVPCPFA
jgi:patatin-like phospholipase/acyl hydrolase